MMPPPVETTIHRHKRITHFMTIPPHCDLRTAKRVASASMNRVHWGGEETGDNK